MGGDHHRWRGLASGFKRKNMHCKPKYNVQDKQIQYLFTSKNTVLNAKQRHVQKTARNTAHSIVTTFFERQLSDRQPRTIVWNKENIPPTSPSPLVPPGAGPPPSPSLPRAGEAPASPAPTHPRCLPPRHVNPLSSHYLCPGQGRMAVKFPEEEKGGGEKEKRTQTKNPNQNPAALSSWGSGFQWREPTANLHMWRSGHSSRGGEEWSRSRTDGRTGPPRTPWPAARRARLLKSNR